MEQCHEYLGCKKGACAMFKMPDATLCWTVEGTLCSSHGIEVVLDRGIEKSVICQKCIYYKAVQSGAVR